MIVGSGRPSVNVDGHGIFSGIAVVVVVSFCNAPLRRGIVSFDSRKFVRARNTANANAIKKAQVLRSVARVVMSVATTLISYVWHVTSQD
jgi:hypothetical protein